MEVYPDVVAEARNKLEDKLRNEGLKALYQGIEGWLSLTSLLSVMKPQ